VIVRTISKERRVYPLRFTSENQAVIGLELDICVQLFAARFHKKNPLVGMILIKSFPVVMDLPIQLVPIIESGPL